MRRLERLVAMALYLSSRRRVLARDVAETFGVSLRTVYRDVSALAKSGFPVEGTAGDGYRVTQSAFLRPLSFTTDEAEALTLATQALAASAPSPLRESLARASAKLEATLDQTMRRRILDLQARIAVPDFLPRASGPIAEVLGAIRDRRVARIRYTDLHEKPSERTIEPLGLVCVGNAWWLVAYCRLRRDARAFRVDRIGAWVEPGDTFTPREGLSFTDVVARDRHLARPLFGS